MGRLVSRKPVEININSPLNGYLPIFDGDTKLWETISSSSLFSSSHLISGSEQVFLTGTTGYNDFSSSYSNLSSSFVTLSGSYASNFESASFTGSYKGDGTQLYNIPISGVTNLTLVTSSIASRLGYLETESGSIRSNFNSFTSSYTTGSFTGSFTGNGEGLYNLPYSGLTNVPTLISGSQAIVNLGFAITGSNVFKGDQTVSGSLEVTSSIITPQILNPNGNINLIPSGGLGGVTLNGQINWVRKPGDPETEIGELIAWAPTMGIIEGGGITIISGLTVQAGEMVAYTMENVPYATHLLLKINTEGSTAASRQITLPANSSVYVYYNSSGTLTYNATAPSTRTNVILGRVITDSTSVLYIDATPINAHHYSNYLDRLFREAMGAIFATGGIVTENATPFRLNVTSSVYFFSQNRITTTGATAPNMDMFYRQATGSTYNIITGNTVDNLYYDNGSGSLASIPSGKYTKHALYLLGTPTQKYLLVYGQDVYDTFGLAEAAGIPIPPTYFKDAFVLIASLVVSPDEASIHTIIDERPRLSYISPSKTGVVTEHGDLTGLEHDDHTQYLLVDGTRAMSGDLDMGGNDISNSLSITTSGLTVTGSMITTGSNKLIGDTQLTGSLTISGSTTQIGNNTLYGNTILSGSLIISGSENTPSDPTIKIEGDIQTDGTIKLLPVNKSINTSLSGSYIYVSGSTDDLYFSQNSKGFNNVTRLRWLEGNLYTGLLNGGLLSATPGGTTFNVGAGSGIIVNLNGSLTDNPYPTVKYVNWNAHTGQTLTNRTTAIQTFVGIDENGQVTQQVAAFNNGTYNTQITLGTVIHQNLSTVNATITYPNLAYGYKQRTYDFIKAFGPLKLSGLSIITTGTVSLNIGSGTAYADGRNYQNDPNNPSYISDSGTTVSKIFRYYQVSGTTFVQDTNNSSGYTDLDVANYNNNGTITAVPGSGSNKRWSLQRIYWYPNSATKGIVAYYGNATYASSTEAAANLPYEPFFEVENTKQNAVYLGAIALRNDATWSDSTSYLVLPGGTFRNVGGSGGGGNVPSNRFTDLVDVDIVNPNNGDIPIYNSLSQLWEHGKQLTGYYEISGSLLVTGSIVSQTTPLVSGSSQIEITGTTGYSTFSSSIALTDLTQSNRLNSIESVTGSYATTGSNHFKQSQVITGSLIVTSFISGSLFNGVPISKGKENVNDNVAIGEGSLNANTTGYANTAVGFNVLSANQGGSLNTAYGKNTLSSNTDGTFNTAIGFGALSSNTGGGRNTAVGFNAGVGLSTPLVNGFNNIFLGSRSEGEGANESNRTWIGNADTTTTWLGGELLLGTRTSTGGDFRATIVGNTQITGSAVITNNLTASLVSASFKGDGSQIYNVPASGVTGLQLNKIVNGSISASLENNALRVNTDVYIDGIITAREIHTDYVTSSVLFQSGSTKFGDTSDDIHQFTGSLSVSGSMSVSDTITGTITNATNAVSSSYPFVGGGTTIRSFNTSNNNITESFIVGLNAGYNATGSWDLTAIGTRAAYEAYAAESVIAIGYQAGYQAKDNSYSIFLGQEAGYQSTTYGSIYMGGGSGYGANADSANFIGYNAGIGATRADYSNFIGVLAGHNAENASGSNFIGSTAGKYQTGSAYSNYIGYNVANNNSSTNYLGRNNIIIGNSLTLPTNSKDSINIGGLIFGTGSFWPDNDMVSDPFPFSGSANGKIGINQPAPQHSLDVVGSIKASDSLIVSSSQITNKNVNGLTAGNQTISTILTGSYTSAFYNYTVSSGSNARAGQIMVIWNGSSITYTDNSTTDIGLTKNVELTASLNIGSVVLSTVLPTDGWTIKTLVNLL